MAYVISLLNQSWISCGNKLASNITMYVCKKSLCLKILKGGNQNQ